MKKLILLCAILGSAFASPAMASTCDESDYETAEASVTALHEAPAGFQKREDTRKVEFAMSVTAELDRAAAIMTYAESLNHRIGAEAQGWPCDQAKAATMMAMRDAATAMATKSKSSQLAEGHDCECEDCDSRLCTEVADRTSAEAPCDDCVDAARIA